MTNDYLYLAGYTYDNGHYMPLALCDNSDSALDICNKHYADHSTSGNGLFFRKRPNPDEWAYTAVTTTLKYHVERYRKNVSIQSLSPNDMYEAFGSSVREIPIKLSLGGNQRSDY